MLGISALNDLVKSLVTISASCILDQLAIRIRESLHQTGEAEESSSTDGMDLALCVYDPETRLLQYAGAYNHLYMINNGEMTVIRADKQEIVSKYYDLKPYTNHRVQMKAGDCIYLFSDGFPDQFGGPDFKKYKYKRFREFLLSIHQEPMAEQKRLLAEEFDHWRNLHEQVDDVLVMGFRIY